MYTLYGRKGWGSTVVEVLLEKLGQPFRFVAIDPWDDLAKQTELKQLNPLGQVPVLVTPEGDVLTESAAIILWLAARYPDSPLFPREAKAQAAFYRWTVFLSANLYMPLGFTGYTDAWAKDSEAAKAFSEWAQKRVELAWQIMEDGCSPNPYLLGGELTALDLYTAMFAQWSDLSVLEQQCPGIVGAVRSTLDDSVVARVWQRNFSR